MLMSHRIPSLLLAFGLFVLLSLTACTGSGGAKGAADSAAMLSEMQWDSLILDRTYYDDDVHKKGSSVDVFINYLFPKADSTLQRLFGRLTFGDGYDSIPPQEALERYAREVRAEYLFAPDDSITMYTAEEIADLKSELSLVTKASFVDVPHGLLSLQKELYTYSAGAAHGLLGTSYYNIDLKTRTVLSEGDLFVDGYQPELAKVLQRCALTTYGCKTVEELEEKIGAYLTDFAPNDNFTLSPEGLIYCYNPYEIAPFAAGTIRVRVPYVELTKLLRPGSPLAAYLPTN